MQSVALSTHLERVLLTVFRIKVNRIVPEKFLLMHTCSIHLSNHAYNASIGGVLFSSGYQIPKNVTFCDHSVYSYFGIRSIERTLSLSNIHIHHTLNSQINQRSG